jgi:short subunit dehydrogenase
MMAFTVPLKQAAAIRRPYTVWRIGGGAGTCIAPNRVVNPALGRLGQVQPQQPQRLLISNCAVRCSGGNNARNKRTNNHHNADAAAVAAAAAGGAQSQQSQSPLGHVGVAAALASGAASSSGSGAGEVRPTIWDEFALKDRVALVSGANRGLGLEMALVLIEAGARAVYCVDLPAQPGKEWVTVSEYVKRMVGGTGGRGRLEYVSADVRDQKVMWKIGEEIGNREGRMDVCVAAAGILKAHTDCLEYPGEEFEEVRSYFLFSQSLSVR